MGSGTRIAGQHVMATNDPVIMVVDDERDFLELTRKLLKRHGYRVDARTRAPSWRELLHIDPALILMDVVLEGENGSDVCLAIKSHKRLTGLPIILVSGHGEDRLQQEVNRCNANGYLTKPIGKVLLLQLADHYVRQHQRAGGQYGAASTAGPTSKAMDNTVSPENPVALPGTQRPRLDNLSGMRAGPDKDQSS